MRRREAAPMRVRASLDSNVLIYAELEPETEKGGHAQRIIAAAAPGGILAAQALLEFLAVVRRRRPDSLPSAMAKVEVWSSVFEIAPTTMIVARAAARLVRDHHLQVWDAVILCAARAVGAGLVLSEDMQDGLRLDGARIANPFNLTPEALDTLLGA
jgi:predicted nucleic acid-binding protein